MKTYLLLTIIIVYGCDTSTSQNDTNQSDTSTVEGSDPECGNRNTDGSCAESSKIRLEINATRFDGETITVTLANVSGSAECTSDAGKWECDLEEDFFYFENRASQLNIWFSNFTDKIAPSFEMNEKVWTPPEQPTLSAISDTAEGSSCSLETCEFTTAAFDFSPCNFLTEEECGQAACATFSAPTECPDDPEIICNNGMSFSHCAEPPEHE
jgi:hypothetical protein